MHQWQPAVQHRFAAPEALPQHREFAAGEFAGFLPGQGFTTARNMIGGMLRWSDEVDPTSAKY